LSNTTPPSVTGPSLIETIHQEIVVIYYKRHLFVWSERDLYTDSGGAGCGYRRLVRHFLPKGSSPAIFCASIESGVVLNIILKGFFSEFFLQILASFLILNNEERFLNN
jgi:hypothetical protein